VAKSCLVTLDALIPCKTSMTSEGRGLINFRYFDHPIPDGQDNLPNYIIEIRLRRRLDIASHPIVVVHALARHWMRTVGRWSSDSLDMVMVMVMVIVLKDL